MILKLENVNNPCKSLSVLQDVRKGRNNPVILPLCDKTTGEKFNIKLSKINKPEDLKSTDTGTCFKNVNKAYDHKKNNKEQNNTQSLFVLPEVISNNHYLPSTSSLLNGYDTGLSNNHLTDYETVLLKVIADLITETNVNSEKRQSGFGVLNGLVVKSHINIKDENIIVVNSKLAKEGGVLLDIPAELISFFKLKDPKTMSNKSDDEVRANIIVKPFTLLVGEYVIKIRICNKRSADIISNTKNEETLPDFRRVFKHKHISTQTESAAVSPTLPIEPERDIKCLVEECEKSSISYIHNVAKSLNSTSIVHSNLQNKKPFPEVLDLTLGHLKNKITLKKATRRNELIKSNKNMLRKKMKSNIKHLNKNTLGDSKYIIRLNNITNRIRDSKDKLQIVEICDKLIKLSKSSQIRNTKERFVCSDLNLKSVFCCSHASKFTIKKSNVINKTLMKNSTDLEQISESNSNLISGFNNDCSFPNTKNEVEVEKINTENINENKIKGVISSKTPMLPENIENYVNKDSKQIITFKNDDKIYPVNNKNKVFNNASTMTETTNIENDNFPLVKNNLDSPRSKKKKFCTCLKKNKVKQQNLMAKKMNEIKNKVQIIDWLLKRGIHEGEKQNDINTNIGANPCEENAINTNIGANPCEENAINTNIGANPCEDKLPSYEKLNCEPNISKFNNTASLLTPILSEPLDNVKYKFSLFGNPQKRYTKCTKSSTENIKFLECPTLGNNSLYEFKSNDVRVACDKCGIMCDLIMNNNHGQFKLQLKSHICLIDRNQIKRIHRDNSPDGNTESHSTFTNRENLFLQHFDSGLSEPLKTNTSQTNTSIMEKNKFQSSYRSDYKLHNRTSKTTSSSSSSATYYLQSSENTDYSSKTMDNVSSLPEVPEKCQDSSVSSRQENTRSDNSLEIECEHCGRSRTLVIHNINGNTILELKSHICLRKENCKSGKLKKLTDKMIPLNESNFILLGNKRDNSDINLYRNDELISRRKNESKECFNMNGTTKNVDRINIPNENKRLYESNNVANLRNENEIDSSNELVNQIKKFLESKCNENSSYGSLNQNDYFIKNINKMTSQKELESESESSFQTKKQNIANNDKEDKLLQKSLLDLITVYNGKQFEHTSSHNGLNHKIKTESEIEVNNATVKHEKGTKRASKESMDTNPKINFKGFVLDNGEIIVVKENKSLNTEQSTESIKKETESEESNVKVEILEEKGIPSQIKLMCEQMSKNKEINILEICPDKEEENSEGIEFKCALDKKVNKKNNLKVIKGKRKTSNTKQVCVIS